MHARVHAGQVGVSSSFCTCEPFSRVLSDHLQAMLSPNCHHLRALLSHAERPPASHALAQPPPPASPSRLLSDHLQAILPPNCHHLQAILSPADGLEVKPGGPEG